MSSNKDVEATARRIAANAGKMPDEIDTPAPDTTEALRRELADHFDGPAFLAAYEGAGAYWTERRAAASRKADAILTGPLAPLLARIATLEAERDEARAEIERNFETAMRDQEIVLAGMRQRKARIDALEAERSCFQDAYKRAAKLCSDAVEKSRALEAENARLRMTLEHIANGDGYTFDESEGCDVVVSLDAEELSSIARAALKPQEPA